MRIHELKCGVEYTDIKGDVFVFSDDGDFLTWNNELKIFELATNYYSFEILAKKEYF